MASENALIRAREAAASALKRAVDRLKKWSNRREVRRGRYLEAAEREVRAQHELNAAVKRLQDAHDVAEPDPDRIAELAKGREKEIVQFRRAAKSTEKAKTKYINARKRRSALTRVRKNWREALNNRIQRLRRWREQHDGPPPYTDAWLNGHPATLDDVAKHNLRLIKDRWPELYVTSTSRNWGTGSYHEQIPTRGFDIAGPWDSMCELQNFLYWNFPGAMLELLGPVNAHMVKNGVKWAAGEGTFLEDLHDTHVHSFFLRVIW